MKRPAALFSIALALGATGLLPEADAREPTPIKACGTISQPGSYELANNLTTNGSCLVITANGVTIDLAGFSIIGASRLTGIGIAADTRGIVVRNGSISGFHDGVVLTGAGSIVEGLRVFDNVFGVSATGIVKGNIVENNGGPNFDRGGGMGATGIVSGNYVTRNATGIGAGQGSTVIGNTGFENFPFSGITVSCPSNVTDNTAVNNGHGDSNLVLEGDGCNDTNNVAAGAFPQSQ